jgi:sortase A
VTATMSGPETAVPAPEQGRVARRRPGKRPGPVGPRRARAKRTPRAPQPQDTTLIATSSAFTMVGLVACWVVLQMLVLGGLSQAREQSLLYDDLREQLAASTVPFEAPIDPGTPVALMEIPALDLRQVVIEGTASGDLLAGPGHLRGTVLPGQEGTSVVMGRAATYGGPFGDIASLRAGDPITVTMAQGVKTFTVLGVRRTGDPLQQPRPAGTARLTLVSAEGDGRLSGLRPGEVVYVDAEAPEAFPAPPAQAATAPDSERPMADDSATAMPLLVLCLALLLGLTLAVVAARQRYSAVLVWVVTTPVAIAVAWQTTDVVMRLLPNLI